MNKTKKQNAVAAALNMYELAIQYAEDALELAAYRADNHPVKYQRDNALNHMAYINETFETARVSMTAVAMASKLGEIDGAVADITAAADQLAESVRIEISIKRGTNDL